MIIHKPVAENLSPYYRTYISYIPEDDMLEALIKQKDITQTFLQSIPESKSSFAYDKGKWMLKEVAGHLCDTERILSYRALRISRNDKTPLPGFEENDYTPNSNYSNRTLSNISDEFKTIRESTISLFKNMNEEMYDRAGITNNSKVSVRDLLFFVVAHERHHLEVIRTKYL